ncbi:Rnf electron transport complex subunit RnfG [Methanohalophilus halophilus]|uniref:Ion-translocating oxidoreductase complex subunit G n=1 Tax=Methanohalophilus halophilus TaxID=2177 RepID=A0A1L3Q252_9EURY|nr:Rnf electron transport complex subunit RnfG [Methanohalophilus halophilus]APH38954.1 electron transporter RnfG [Methanohalophilus halophilus]RNI09989.1 RnfABCDGE type electron transport complex subunit G [Methanohalophilus halophilus]SDW65159.1 electron transport complex protein RnfG [Methanohalophilus halophilus]
MTESPKDIAVIIGKLVLVSLVAALLLGLTYVPTQEQLEKNEVAAKKEALSQVVPSASDFEPVYGNEVDEEGNRNILYYKAVDSSGNLVGYAFFKTQSGAQDVIQLAGGVDPSFNKVTGMEVMKHSETPGLGSKIAEEDFKGQFRQLPIGDLQLSSAGGSIDAITGATISSQAVVDGLNTKIDDVKEQET